MQKHFNMFSLCSLILLSSNPKAMELDILSSQVQLTTTIASAFYEFLGSEKETEDALNFAKKTLPAAYKITSKAYQLIQVHRETRDEKKPVSKIDSRLEKHLTLPLFMMSNIDIVYKYYYWIGRDILRKVAESKSLNKRDMDSYLLSDTILAAQERDLYLNALPPLIITHLQKDLPINVEAVVTLLKQTSSTKITTTQKRQADIDSFLYLLAKKIIKRFDKLKAELNIQFLSESDIHYTIKSFYDIHRDPWSVTTNIMTFKEIFQIMPDVRQIVGMLTGFDWSDILTKEQDRRFHTEFSFLERLDDTSDETLELLAMSSSSNVICFHVKSNSPIKRCFDSFWGHIKDKNPGLFRQISTSWQKQRKRLLMIKTELQSMKTKALNSSVKMARIVKRIVKARNITVQGLKVTADIVRETELMENQEIRTLIEIIDSLPKKIEIPYVDEIASGNFDFTQDLLTEGLELEHKQFAYPFAPPITASASPAPVSDSSFPSSFTAASSPEFASLSSSKLSLLLTQGDKIQRYLGDIDLLKEDLRSQLETLVPNLKHALPFLSTLPSYLEPTKTVIDTIKEKGLRVFPLNFAEIFKTSLIKFFTNLLSAEGSDMIKYLLNLSPDQHKSTAAAVEILINDLPSLIEDFPNPETSSGLDILKYLLIKASDIEELNDIIRPKFPNILFPDLKRTPAINIIESIISEQSIFSTFTKYFPHIYSMPSLKKLENISSFTLLQYLMGVIHPKISSPSSFHPPSDLPTSSLHSLTATSSLSSISSSELQLKQRTHITPPTQDKQTTKSYEDEPTIDDTAENELAATQTREQENLKTVITNPLQLITTVLQGYPKNESGELIEIERKEKIITPSLLFPFAPNKIKLKNVSTYIPSPLLNVYHPPPFNISYASTYIPTKLITYKHLLKESASLALNIKLKAPNIKPLSSYTNLSIYPQLPHKQTNQPMLLKTSLITKTKKEKQKTIEYQFNFVIEDDGKTYSTNSNKENKYITKSFPKSPLNFFINLKIFYTSRKELSEEQACIYFL